MNLANSANPVIARILMDLGLLKHEIGTLIMTATIMADLVNWTLFALVLSDIAPLGGSSSASPNFGLSILLVLLIFVVACVSKIGAVLLGARLAGMPVDRKTLAIGFSLNARRNGHYPALF